jgi:hypothetical protein
MVADDVKIYAHWIEVAYLSQSPWIFYKTFRKDPAVPPEDKQKIKELLKKPWNPYIRMRDSSSAKTKQTVVAALTADADVVKANIIAKSPQIQEAACRKLVEHNKLDLILENSELKEALKRQTTLQRADQVSANEITFVVPEEKFNQLKEAMETSRVYTFGF